MAQDDADHTNDVVPAIVCILTTQINLLDGCTQNVKTQLVVFPHLPCFHTKATSAAKLLQMKFSLVTSSVAPEHKGQEYSTEIQRGVELWEMHDP